MFAPLLLLSLLACSDKDAGADDDDDDIGLDTGWDGGGTDGGSGDAGSGDGGGSGNDADNDGYDSIESGGDDCDDSNPDIHPFADEYCNGIDDDCDGNTDEDSAVDATKWYPDVDEDGYGDDDESDFACNQPDDGKDWITTGGDCDDDDDAIHPGADETCDGVDEDCDEETDEDAVDASDWYRDVDEDGFGGDTVEHACSPPDDGAAWSLDSGDCDDEDELIHPDATEVCDDVDNDCDDLVDDADPSVDESTWTIYYADDDEDGFGDADAPLLSCSRPDGHVIDAGDCDDSRSDINPGEVEVCDADDTDEDCSGAADDDDPDVEAGGLSTWVEDADRDGFGSDSAVPVFACDDPSGTTRYVLDDDTDCDDGDPAVNPDATEVCDDDDTDEDCSGAADDDDPGTSTATMSTWYLDSDEDGYGAGGSDTTQCDDPSSGSAVYVDNADDCDDDRADVSPDGTEVCDDDDTDEDCDGRADDDDGSTANSSKTTWYLDDDGDGFGDADTSLRQCEDPSDATSSWVLDDTDCDDEHDVVNPDAEEVCDAYDNDCDPSTSSDGFVTFTSDAGDVTDYTADFAAGTSSSPAAITLDEAGELSLCGGTLYTQLTISADVRLVGLYAPVLSGGDQGTVVIVESSASEVSFADLEITEGYADQSYGSTTVAGGGIWCSGSDLVFEDTIVSDSYSEDYAAGIYAASCPITADGLVVRGNTASVTGGGLWLQGSSHTIMDSEISDNTATSSGGGILMRSSATLDLVDSWVIDNYSSTQGSAAYLTTDTLHCSATSAGSGGFLRNTGGSSYGAVRLANSGVIVTSDDCDWGDGSDDNEPHDLHSSYWSPTTFDADGVATFSCTGSSACE